MRIAIGTGSNPKADNQTLIITIDNRTGRTLSARQTIGVAIGKSATDLEGNNLRDAYSFSFSTGGYGIIATSPANGQVLNHMPGGMQPIDIYFNCAIMPAQINANSLRITPQLAGVHAVPIIMDNPATGWSIIRWLPYLEGDKTYRVTVNRGLKTTSGQRVSELPYTFSFTLNSALPNNKTGPKSISRRRHL